MIQVPLKHCHEIMHQLLEDRTDLVTRHCPIVTADTRLHLAVSVGLSVGRSVGHIFEFRAVLRFCPTVRGLVYTQSGLPKSRYSFKKSFLCAPRNNLAVSWKDGMLFLHTSRIHQGVASNAFPTIQIHRGADIHYFS